MRKRRPNRIDPTLRKLATRYAFANTPRFRVNPERTATIEPWYPPEIGLPRANGYVIYDGPSQLTSEPILVIVTGFLRPSRNEKTGERLLQSFIIMRDVDPIDAVHTGADEGICGSCIHRGVRTESGSYEGRSCYVNVAKSVTNVYEAWRNGSYPLVAFEKISPLLASAGRLGLGLRMGTYGDPVAVPVEIWREALGVGGGRLQVPQAHVTRPEWAYYEGRPLHEGYYDVQGAHLPFWTGYTHQWRLKQAQVYRHFLMASVDNLLELVQAHNWGWRTFRVSRSSEPRVPGVEITCPASEEAGKRTTCDACTLCMGTAKKARSIVIMPHGTGARFHEERQNPDEDLQRLARETAHGDVSAGLRLLKTAVRHDPGLVYELVLGAAIAGSEIHGDPAARRLMDLAANVTWWVRWARDGEANAQNALRRLLNGDFDENTLDGTGSRPTSLPRSRNPDEDLRALGRAAADDPVALERLAHQEFRAGKSWARDRLRALAASGEHAAALALARFGIASGVPAWAEEAKLHAFDHSRGGSTGGWETYDAINTLINEAYNRTTPQQHKWFLNNLDVGRRTYGMTKIATATPGIMVGVDVPRRRGGLTRRRRNPDEDLRALERALAVDPGNEALRHRVRQARARAGDLRSQLELEAWSRGNEPFYTMEGGIPAVAYLGPDGTTLSPLDLTSSQVLWLLAGRRDPRRDPIPGDVLGKEGRRLVVTGVEIRYSCRFCPSGAYADAAGRDAHERRVHGRTGEASAEYVVVSVSAEWFAYSGAIERVIQHAQQLWTWRVVTAKDVPITHVWPVELNEQSNPPHHHPHLPTPLPRRVLEEELHALHEQAGLGTEADVAWPRSLARTHRRNARRYAQVAPVPRPAHFELAEQARYLPDPHRRGLLAHEIGHVLAPYAGENGADAAALAHLGIEVGYDHRWPGRGLQVAVNPAPRPLSEAEAVSLRRMIGQRIGAARSALGLSQRALAQHFGMSPSWVREVETGQQYAPHYLVLAMAEAAGQPLEYFYGGPPGEALTIHGAVPSAAMLRGGLVRQNPDETFRLLERQGGEGDPAAAFRAAVMEERIDHAAARLVKHVPEIGLEVFAQQLANVLSGPYHVYPGNVVAFWYWADENQPNRGHLGNVELVTLYRLEADPPFEGQSDFVHVEIYDMHFGQLATHPPQATFGGTPYQVPRGRLPAFGGVGLAAPRAIAERFLVLWRGGWRP